jgi:hypothetical protein
MWTFVYLTNIRSKLVDFRRAFGSIHICITIRGHFIQILKSINVRLITIDTLVAAMLPYRRLNFT